MDLKKLKVNSDFRGSFIETFHLPTDGQISYVTILPEETRGNHYHLRKTERFVVVYGSAVFTVKDRVTEDLMKVTVTGAKPMAITVVPNHTHALTATDEGAVVLIWVDEQFDKEDPDTYSEEI